MKTLKYTLALLIPFALLMANPAKSDKREDLDFQKVGETFYDLQTNASMQRRIILHEGGGISVVWTTSPEEQPPWATRGSGYNYFDGNEWTRGDDVISPLETGYRTGWPELGVISDGSDGMTEYVISHFAGADNPYDGGLAFSTNSAIGTFDFNTATLLTPEGDEEMGPIWPRTAVSGDYIYILASYSASFTGDNVDFFMDGVNYPTVYSKYNYIEDSFYVRNELLPGFDSTTFLSGPADRYAMEAQDSNVAILMGSLGTNLYLWESSDYGESWNRTTVDSFPHSPFDFAEDDPFLEPDEEVIVRNDGSFSLMLDSEGRAHVSFGETGTRFSSQANGHVVNRHSMGLRYWNSDMGEEDPILIAFPVDRTGDDTALFEDVALSSTVYPNYGNTGQVTMPNFAYDDDGNIFVVYRSVLEEGFVFTGGPLLSDIYVVYSTDGGVSWSDPQNITDDLDREQMFPAVARNVDDHLHVIFQESSDVGSFASDHDNDPDVFSGMRSIFYVNVPVDRILTDDLGPGTLEEEDPNFLTDQSNNNNLVSKAYPNPFADQTRLELNLSVASDVQVEVTNLTGQTIYNEKFNRKAAGSHNIDIDGSNWQSGIYLINVQTNNQAQTFRVIKK